MHKNPYEEEEKPSYIDAPQGVSRNLNETANRIGVAVETYIRNDNSFTVRLQETETSEELAAELGREDCNAVVGGQKGRN